MDKNQLRADCKKRRAAIPAEDKKRLDDLIRRRIAETEEFRRADTVLLYVPVRGEIDLLPLASLCRRLGKEVGFPVSMEDGSLTFRSPAPGESLVTGAYGIPEPAASAKPSTITKKTLCVLPGLSFDEKGNRLGYGKGYYDRFLSDFPGVTLGAVYRKLMVEELPTEPHDRPVHVLVHESGVIRPSSTDEADPSAREGYLQRAKKRVSAGLYHAFTPWRALLHRRMHPNGETSAEEADVLAEKPVRPLVAPPLLVLSTFLLLILSRVIEAGLTSRGSEYVTVILLQLLIFVLPAILYIQLRGDGFPPRIRMRAVRPEHLWFCFCALAVLITGNLLLSILTGGISSANGNFTLYNTFVAHMNGSPMETVYLLLAYAVLPAFCEELVYRSILCAEYEGMGTGISVVVSALFFAMLHFSFPAFLGYFLSGLLLAAVMYATRSALAPMLLHLLYNLFCLFGQPYLSAFYVNAGSSDIFLFCLITLFLLFAAFAAGEARKIYHLYAIANLPSDYTVSVRGSDYPKRLWTAVKTPAVAVVFLLWLVMAILDLFH